MMGQNRSLVCINKLTGDAQIAWAGMFLCCLLVGCSGDETPTAAAPNPPQQQQQEPPSRIPPAQTAQPASEQADASAEEAPVETYVEEETESATGGGVPGTGKSLFGSRSDQGSSPSLPSGPKGLSAPGGGGGGKFGGFSGFQSGDSQPAGLQPGSVIADFAQVAQFVQQNCVSCHSGNKPKGEVRLDQLGEEIASQSDLWSSIMTVLDDGTMPPAAALLQPDPTKTMQVVEFIRQNLGEVGEKSYMELAKSAYKKGENDRAIKLFYAHALTVDDNEAAEVLDNIRLYRPNVVKPEDLKASNNFATTIKPHLTTSLNFAVGVVLDAGEKVTDVKPIGVWQRSGGAGGYGGAADDNSKLEAFEDLTGDFGKALVDAVKSRRHDGKFGTLFADLEPPVDAAVAEEEGVAGAEGLGGQFRGGGAFIPPGGKGGGADAGNLLGKTAKDKSLAHGFTYLGTGTANELLKKAVEIGVDGLFIFDVKAELNRRTSVVTNDTRLRFMLPSGRVVAGTSSSLKNIDFEKAKMDNKESPELEEQMDKMFQRLDDILALVSVPKMSESAAIKHIHGQLHSGADVLQVMAEARLFHSKGIIDSERLQTIYQIALEGNEGISLATGSADDRKLVLELTMPDLKQTTKAL